MSLREVLARLARQLGVCHQLALAAIPLAQLEPTTDEFSEPEENGAFVAHVMGMGSEGKGSKDRAMARTRASATIGVSGGTPRTATLPRMAKAAIRTKAAIKAMAKTAVMAGA